MGHKKGLQCPFSLFGGEKVKIRALVSFAGKVTMAPGQIRDVPDDIAEDLIQAKYAEKVTTSKKSGAKSENK